MVSEVYAAKAKSLNLQEVNLLLRNTMRRNGRTTRLLLVLLAFFVVAGIGCTSAATIYVPDTYGTIQQAVDNAHAGDTIVVRDGTYTENVKVNTSYLTIQAQHGPASCIVQAANFSEHIFGITADYVTVRGFAMNGVRELVGNKSGIYGAGVDLTNSSSNTITDNIFSNSRDKSISLVSSTNNTISRNTISNSWGGHGIYLNSSTNNTITGNTISNIKGGADGIYLYFSTNNTISSNTISKIEDTGSSIKVLFSTNNAITSNAINNTGGISLGASSNNTIISNTISYNTNGINLYRTHISWGSSQRSSSNTITGNTISHSRLNGILMSFSTNNTITHNTISNNPFGIKLEGSTNNAIADNTVSDNRYDGILLSSSDSNSITGNTVYNNSDIGIHERFHFDKGSSTNSITNNIVFNNRVDYTSEREQPPTPSPSPSSIRSMKYFMRAVDYSASESGDTATIIFWSEQDPHGILVNGSLVTVDGWSKQSYSIGGTATNGIDYEYLTGEVYVELGAGLYTPPEDAPHEKIVIKPRADARSEGNETVEITFGENTVAITIADSTPPTPTPPGFTALLAVGGLVAAAYCAMKRKANGTC